MHFEEVKGGLEGLLIGEVLHCTETSECRQIIGDHGKYRSAGGVADCLRCTKCCSRPEGGGGAGGSHNLSSQRRTVFNYESGQDQGRRKSWNDFCAEDETGLGESHEGIMVLLAGTIPGTMAKDYFQPYSDTVISIGLTPNRSDAMSHLGVARDICAWLNHHENKDYSVCYPGKKELDPVNRQRIHRRSQVGWRILHDCPRYAGIGLQRNPRGANLLRYGCSKDLSAIGCKTPSVILLILLISFSMKPASLFHAFDADRIKGLEGSL